MLVLYHYTTKTALQSILSSQELLPSTRATSPSDVRYGNGQYLTDIKPGTMISAEIARRLLRVPFARHRFTHYLEIEVSGLRVIQGRPGVYVIPNNKPLPLQGRIVSSGAN
jgi:HYD1 signature containing ADP-ribosyltransferase